MKIAFTTTGNSLESPFEERFGRAPAFLVCDLETSQVELLSNSENADSAHGAGLRAAQTVARAGAEGLVTGRCGPKALQALSSAGIQVYECSAATVAEALDQFRQGVLKPVAGLGGPGVGGAGGGGMGRGGGGRGAGGSGRGSGGGPGRGSGGGRRGASRA